MSDTATGRRTRVRLILVRGRMYEAPRDFEADPTLAAAARALAVEVELPEDLVRRWRRASLEAELLATELLRVMPIEQRAALQAKARR